MQDTDKETLRNLGWGILVAVLAMAYSYGRRAYEWRGSVVRATGTVSGCTEHYDTDSGEVYTTSFTFTDASGRKIDSVTRGLHYCLPVGHGINLEYPVRDPGKARPLAQQ